MSYPPSNVLVPFDFSDRSFDAIRRALSFVASDGIVHVVHIIDDYLPAYAASKYPGTMEEKHRVLHRRQMEKEIDKSGIDRGSLSLHCELGDPGTEIARLAAKLSADLVVIPSHGRRGVKRWLLGSVAERVARLSPCSVLILKSNQRGQAHEGATG